MRRVVYLVVLVLFVAVAHGGDAPIRWKNPPMDTVGEITSGTLTVTDSDWVTTTTADSVLRYSDASGSLSYVPQTQIAPAAVRFEAGTVICPHCRNEFRPKDGGHTIVLEGTKGEYETCIDTVIEILDELGALKLANPKD